MKARDVLAVLDLLEREAPSVCVDGGWGVDALLARETRPHSDLDLIVDADEVGAAVAALARLGFSPRGPTNDDANVVAADSHGRVVDIHGVERDARGRACFRLPDGRVWPFPRAALEGAGRIDGRRVRCLSPDAQVQCHAQGYVPSEKDLADMEALQEQFGIVLPLHLCRQPGSD